MSRYRVTVDGQQYDVDIDDPHARPVKATLGNTEFSVDVETNGEITQTSDKTPIAAPRLAPRPIQQTDSPDGLTAPIPGIVASINVTTGQSVKRGDELLTLEAMKMLNVIRSPRDGLVETVHIAEGAQVSQGDPLVTFAPT